MELGPREPGVSLALSMYVPHPCELLSGNALDDEQGRELPPELHQLLRLLWQPDPGHPLVDSWKRLIWSFFRTPTGWPSGGGIIV